MINYLELSHSTFLPFYRVCTVVNVSDIMIKKTFRNLCTCSQVCLFNTDSNTLIHTHMCVCFSSAHTTRLNRNIRWQLCALIERRAMFMPCYEIERRAPATIGGTIRMGYGVYMQCREPRVEKWKQTNSKRCHNNYTISLTSPGVGPVFELVVGNSEKKPRKICVQGWQNLHAPSKSI